MDNLVILLLILAGLISFILVAGLVVKKKYSIKRNIVINKSRQDVFAYVKYLRNQVIISSKWVMTHPEMEKVSGAKMEKWVLSMRGMAIKKQEKVNRKSRV